MGYLVTRLLGIYNATVDRHDQCHIYIVFGRDELNRRLHDPLGYIDPMRYTVDDGHNNMGACFQSAEVLAQALDKEFLVVWNYLDGRGKQADQSCPGQIPNVIAHVMCPR